MGIREILLLMAVAPLALAALVRPQIGVYGYLWYALMRPDIWAWVEDKYPVSLIFAICMGLGSWSKAQYFPVILKNPITRLILLLQIPIAISVLTSVYPELTYARYNFYLRMIAVYLLMAVVIQTEKELLWMLVTITCSLGYVALRFGVYGVIHGGVDLGAGGYGTMLSDNNFLSSAVVVLIPLAWYCRSLVTNKIFKTLFLLMVLFGPAAVVMGNSRGGAIGLVVGMLLIVLRTKGKVAALLVLSLCFMGTVYLVKDMFIARMSTLKDPTAELSAASRLVHIKASVQVWTDHPLTGVGFGGLVYARMASKYTGQELNQVVHNSYLQTLADSGIFAFLIYVTLIFYPIFWLNRSIRITRAVRPDLAPIPIALQSSLIVFAIVSSFYSLNRVELSYVLLLAVAAWHNVYTSVVANANPEEIEAPAAESY